MKAPSAIARATGMTAARQFVAGLLASAMVASAPPAFAQGTQTAFVLSQCATELGLTEAECACVIDTARMDLSPRQIDYLLVRIARNDAEVARMRGFMGLFERLAILFAVERAVAICAPGKDVRMPES